MLIFEYKNLIRHSCVLSLIVMFAFVQSDSAAHNLGFQIVRRLGIFLFSPGCENRPSQSYPTITGKFARTHQFKHLAGEFNEIPKKIEPGQE